MRFSDIIGLGEIKDKLTKSAQRNHHAQIFSGPPGSGNLALALAYGSFINCESPSEDDSCGQCPSCIKIDKFIHPDFHFIFPVSSTSKWKGKDVISSNFLPEWRSFLTLNPFATLEDWINYFGGENKQVNISKEESRQIIQKLSLKAFEAEYKIMLIWLPEWMHPSAANAILKILEEPPQKTLFLLVSNNYERLLTTITSRAQLVNIRAFNIDEVKEFIMSNTEGNNTRIDQLAQLSEGNLSLALQILDQEITEQSDQRFSDWMRLCWQNNFELLVSNADEFQSMSKLAQKSLISSGLTLLRNALLSDNDLAQLMRVNEDESDFVSKFGKAVNLSKIEVISNELSEAFYHLERNASPKMTFLDLSLRINMILKS